MSRRTQHKQLFAVVRVDTQEGSGSEDSSVGPNITVGPYSITIKEIVATREEAQREVVRLNTLNGPKGCRYYWQGARHFPAGGSFGTLGDKE